MCAGRTASGSHPWPDARTPSRMGDLGAGTPQRMFRSPSPVRRRAAGTTLSLALAGGALLVTAPTASADDCTDCLTGGPEPRIIYTRVRP